MSRLRKVTKIVDVLDIEIAPPKHCETGIPMRIRIELFKHIDKELYGVSVFELHPYHILPSETAASFDPSLGHFHKELYAYSESFSFFAETIKEKTKRKALDAILKKLESAFLISIDVNDDI